MDAIIIGLAAAIALGLIGAIGGIPQIIQWSKPKPHLKLTHISLASVAAKTLKADDRYNLHVVLENTRRFLSRSGDTEDLKLEFQVLDMNNQQCGEIQTFSLAQNLPAGEEIDREITVRPAGRPEVNPHTLVLKIISGDGQIIKRKMLYEF